MFILSNYLPFINVKGWYQLKIPRAGSQHKGDLFAPQRQREGNKRQRQEIENEEEGKGNKGKGIWPRGGQRIRRKEKTFPIGKWQFIKVKRETLR